MKTLVITGSVFAAVCLAAFMLAGERPATVPTPEVSETSVYQLTSEWHDQDGKPFRLASMSGRPQLVAMVFTHCGYACPRIVDELRSILLDVPEAGVLLVSIDPERDTSDALKHFAEMHGLSSSRWTLVRGSDADVRELSAVLGVRYKKEAGGEFAHSNTIALLDAGGEIVARNESLDAGRAELVARIREML